MNQIRYGKLMPCTGAQPAVFKNAMVAPSLVNGAKKTFSFSKNSIGSIHGFVARGDAIEEHAAQKLTAAQNAVSAMRQARATQYANRASHA